MSSTGAAPVSRGPSEDQVTVSRCMCRRPRAMQLWLPEPSPVERAVCRIGALVGAGPQAAGGLEACVKLGARAPLLVAVVMVQQPAKQTLCVLLVLRVVCLQQ